MKTLKPVGFSVYFETQGFKEKAKIVAIIKKR